MIKQTEKVKIKSLRDFWISYLETCIPRGAGLNQVEGFRIAFYSGAAAIMELNITISQKCFSFKDGEKILNSLQSELKQFYNELKD